MRIRKKGADILLDLINVFSFSYTLSSSFLGLEVSHNLIVKKLAVYIKNLYEENVSIGVKGPFVSYAV
jgi:hypothetical protein